MAIRACRECGKDISTSAKTCPHCGAAGAVTQSSLNGCLALVVLIVVGAGFLWLAAPSSNGPNAAADSGSDSASKLVFIGNRGRLARTAMACADEADIESFDDDLAQAFAAKAEIGKEEAMQRAESRGCVGLTKGESGLVIDSKGFLIGYDQLRMDRSGGAYWVQQEALEPTPSPNKPTNR
jgi:hypothetical protein